MQHQRRFVIDPPGRVLLLGSPGSGRAGLADLIASRFSLPSVALDRERMLFGAQSEAWRRHVTEMAAAPNWVMTGNDLDSLSVRTPRADWLVFLDKPVSSCLFKVLRAALSGRAEKRKHLERGLWSAIKEAWSFPTTIAPVVMKTIEQERRNRTIFILHSNRDIAGFLAKLPDVDAAGPGQKGAPAR
ncbi:MAG TPA: hypothetical protein VMU56_04335 [Beijerinckiaceae bacterium]|nr:hypothetical protein [Beijerinckiaceae bacterium]